MTFPLRKLGTLGDFRNGLNYSKANFGQGLKVISVKDFGNRWNPDLTTLGEIDPAGLQFSQHDLRAGDIVFVRSNGNKELVGRSMLIEQDLDDVSFSGFCIRFRPTAELSHSKFLSLYFRTPLFRRVISLQGKGTTINNLNQTILDRLDVPWPKIAEQERIVEIASAYDDLIENNRRRIALLEEAARLHYREWFFHFRFPGHEQVEITGGVPKDWRRVRLKKILNVLESGGRPRGGALDSDSDGIPSIGAENVIGLGQYDFSKEKYVPEEYFSKMRRGVIQSRDVMLYKDGAHIGRSSMFGDGFPHPKCAVNEHVFILRVNVNVGQSYFYFWLSQPETRQSVANLNANTAQPGISQDKLKTLWFLLPPEGLRRLFVTAHPFLGAESA